MIFEVEGTWEETHRSCFSTAFKTELYTNLDRATASDATSLFVVILNPGNRQHQAQVRHELAYSLNMNMHLQFLGHVGQKMIHTARPALDFVVTYWNVTTP